MGRRYGRAVLGTALIVLTTNGCSDGLAPTGRPVIESLGAGQDEATLDYVARFAAANEAAEHATAVQQAGGRVTRLNDLGTVLRIEVPRAGAAKLRVDTSALVAPNGKVRLVRAGPRASSGRSGLGSESPINADDAILDALTVRRVTGVESLAARQPAADGRGVKVAVFDTGIDFGVEGVSTGDKLAGFYDLTRFGQVSTTPTATSVPQASYDVQGKVIAVNPLLGLQQVLATGVLDEAAVGQAYDLFGGVDLNGNQVTHDKFPFIVAENREGRLAVFVDVDASGSVDPREELTDFNATGKFIDLNHDHPSGARPLAVSLAATLSGPEVQFHSVPGGHGTSCAIIIAGDGYADGRLKGLAPKARLVSYTLDASGQDFYTMAQFLAMFLHAKAQGVDAISLSWGFATADLASARFLADFLDQEIAAAGIVVGIAAGNEGPGHGSSAGDDYVPHHGFGVGALISQDQARNVYGWTGEVGDHMIWYSSVGPTRGGRLVPDIASPLMSYVRGQRDPEGPSFYGFGGTSSATPALIGSVAAMVSALKAAGEAPINPRLLKLSLQQAAKPLPGVDPLRQGAGVLDVDAAYDLYLQLAGELKAAQADPTKRSKFAYDLRAEVPVEGLAGLAEGVVLRGFHDAVTVAVKMTPETAALVDPLVTVEPLLLEPTGGTQVAFFDAPEVVPVQSAGAQFTLRFDRQVLSRPGVYTETLQLKRARDGLVLLRIPVVVTLGQEASADGRLVSTQGKLDPTGVWRASLSLDENTELCFDGVAIDHGGNARHGVVIQIYDALGRGVASVSQALDAPVVPLKWTTPVLPSGHYEVVINRTFRQPAALGALALSGGFRLPRFRVLASQHSATTTSLGLEARGPLPASTAVLDLGALRVSSVLTRTVDDKGRDGYRGSLDLGGPVSGLAVALRQSDLDRVIEGFLNVEIVVVDADTKAVLYRGWHDIRPEDGTLQSIELPAAARNLAIFAYPNIVDCAHIQTGALHLTAEVPLGGTISAEAQTAAVGGGRFKVVFPIAAPTGAAGTVSLRKDDGTLLETVAVAL